MDDRMLLRQLSRWHTGITALFITLAGLTMATLSTWGHLWPAWIQPIQLGLLATLALAATVVSLVVVRPLLHQLNLRADQQEVLALVARHTNNAVIITDAQGNTEWVNDGFAQITGYSLDEIRGKRPGDLLQGPATDQATVASIRAAISAGHSSDTELLNYHKDGHVYWLAMNITPIYGADGQLRRFIAIEADVSAQKDLERLLRLALKDASDVTNAINQATICTITDRHGRIIDANDQFCAISGYQREALLGADHRIINSGVHPKAFFQELWQTIADGAIWRGEICNRARDGQLYWVDTTIVPLLDIHGKPERYLSIRFDITARKQLELALRDGEEEIRFQKTLLECQLDAAIDGILVVDPEQRWLYANRRFVELWKLPDEVVAAASYTIGLPVMLAQVEDPEELQTAIDGLHTQPAGAEHAEMRLRDGRTFERYTAPVSSKSGTMYGRVWYYRDISERKLIEQMKNEFVSVVSHELRTPLTSIRGALGLVSGGIVGQLPPQAEAMINIAQKNSDRLIRLINDFLDIEKIESGKMEFHFTPLDLRHLIANTLEENQAYAAELHVTLATADPLPALWVNGDSDRLTQVLTNLLSNAAKFSPPGATVVVGMELSNGMARIQVTDAGPGIPEAFREQIFQRFAQADSSNTRRQGGTGLGLNISRAIVERHNGQIGFVSTMNVGTSFHIDLPAITPPCNAATSAGAPWPRIVVCTSNANIAALLVQLLHQAGYSADVAEDVIAAQKLLAAEQYTGLVIGLSQNGSAEHELINLLRANERYRSLPIVAVAAQVDEARHELSGTAVAITDWLSTPIDPDQLVASVQLALAEGVEPHLPANVLHVEDEHDLAKVMALLLGDQVRLTHVQSVADAQTQLLQTPFDLVILDLELRDGSGLELLPWLSQQPQASPPVLVFSGHETGPELAPFVASALVKSRISNESLRDEIVGLLKRQRHAQIQVAALSEGILR